MNASLREEVARRRTFAIISHPDAGKTTLTEKFLLYGGAVMQAGSVTAAKNHRSTTSDWMELERKRGISVSSTVLQFDYRGYAVNLLDTPGHNDFSEDTYRVLTAVDTVVMVIDAGKGIETQTRKLFEICRHRKIPIFTFMNKLDRPTKDPLELMDELESVLGIHAFAMNWPLGTGSDFRGVFDRVTQQVHLFERTPHGAYRAPVKIADLSDPVVKDRLSENAYQTTVEELEMLGGAGADFDRDEVLSGRLTPVFFGSAINNFGVQLLLDAFLDHAAEPRGRESRSGLIEPDNKAFSSFVFKIQANTDPKHRDRLAFLRVCSGQFSREMPVTVARSGKRIKLNSAHKMFGQERETSDSAFPGDVIGIVGHSDLRIGDTLTEDPSIVYDAIPRFAPECFAYLHATNTAHFKRFRDGLDQLLQEGVIQVLQLKDSFQRVPLLGAVGPLQFEVVQFRMQSEYNSESRLERMPWNFMRWLDPSTTESDLDALTLPGGCNFAQDREGRWVVLFSSEWSERYFVERNPKTTLISILQG